MDHPGNRLAREQSPYLRQHADNPVDWYPWNDEAFEKARKEDKPVFLSIGYSTCHWCHVMAHESFEDSRVARMMNDAFVCVKVDREERPDIDKIYMTVCQMMTGSGGWPLTIIMTPDKHPFYATTYIPRERRFGRPGMTDLIPRIAHLWRMKRGDIDASSARIADLLHGHRDTTPGNEPGEEILTAAFDRMSLLFDGRHGGFGSAPKFPSPHNILFLLRYWRRTGTAEALAMAEQTLLSMRRGGIYDHVGFGFHRYATDESWTVPHFEKMLYDQAMLALAYTEAFQATGKEFYGATAREVLHYVMRDMTAPEGGFYSAEDADIEGDEGKFYLWSMEELTSVLTKDEIAFLEREFNLLEEGNFRDEATGKKNGRNILHMKAPIEVRTTRTATKEDGSGTLPESMRRKVFAERETRVHPHKDDKILTDWNGLMIAAFARAARVFGEPRFEQSAVKASAFLFGTLRDETGRLLHRYRDGDAGIRAHLDDYAFLIWGLLELYETTYETEYLSRAHALQEEQIDHFWDDGDGGFFFTAADGEPLLFRMKDAYDGAIPSGNSVAFHNLTRLSLMTGRHDYLEKAFKLAGTFAKEAEKAPTAFTHFLTALDLALGPSFEVVVTGTPGAVDTKEMLAALRSRFIPNAVVLFKPRGKASSRLAEIAPFTKDIACIKEKATAYLCSGGTCRLPTNDAAEIIGFLDTAR